jgi:hypothetical protein
MENVNGIDDGVEVIQRDEDNYDEVSEKIAEALINLSQKNKKKIDQTRNAALKLADSADWEHFIVHYEEAYCKALHNSIERLSAKNNDNE